MVVKTQDVRTPCYSDIYNIINNYTNTYYLYTLLFAKLYAENVINKAFHKHGVASFTGAWIETTWNAVYKCKHRSHPLRVRGLKPIVSALTTNVFLSHPLRVRGLKHLLIQDVRYCYVASFTGAWIETLYMGLIETWI